MSGQLLLNRVLVEKEKALGRRALVNTYVGLATAFTFSAIGYSTLTYLAAQPALSRSPQEVEASKASGSSVSALSEPECGAKLLLSIFSRLWGSGPQLAMLQDGGNRWAYKPNAWGAKNLTPRDAEMASNADKMMAIPRPSAEAQFSQGLSTNAADPALSIRPQVNKRATMDDLSNSQQSQNQASFQQYGGGQSVQSSFSAIPSQSAKAKAALQQTGWYKNPVAVKIISESPDIKEFAQGSKREQAVDARAKGQTRREVNVVDEPLGRARMEHANLIEQSKELAAAPGGADSVTGIIRPSEQPGLFKYVREYYKEPLKNMPPPEGVPAAAPMSIPQILDGSSIISDSKIAEENETASKSASSTRSLAGGGGGSAGKSVAASFDVDKDMGRGFNISNLKVNKKKQNRALQQIAFLPPNAVHGITGLSLGASTSETAAFFKSHGKFSKIVISGFQIFTLKGERGTTILQAFVRSERLEALRVFSSVFVPPQLGVDLGEDLPSMKAKFGEPAFILEEPRVNTKAPYVVAKNYVYPVSQVSFQLSRRSAATAPQVLSMMLFRFL
jgi:hypothetical protein